jgi:hypothetical protein
MVADTLYRLVLFFILALGWLAAAYSQDERTAILATCKVHARDGSGGSGTLIGPRLVISAKHVFRDGGYENAYVDFGRGRIKIIAAVQNKNADQVILEIEQPAGVSPVKIADAAPRSGETLIGYGYGRGLQRFGSWRARLAGYGSKGSDPGDRYMESANTSGESSELGDSGGSVFNSRHEYIGTLWGGGNDGFVFVRYEETRDFIDRTGLLDRINGGSYGSPVPNGNKIPMPGGTVLSTPIDSTGAT